MDSDEPPPNLVCSTASSLLERVRQRDTGAWERLVRWSGPMVLYWCRRAGLATEDREDIFQEVFLAVTNGLARFEYEPGRSSFRGWLLTITRNKIVDLARRRV